MFHGEAEGLRLLGLGSGCRVPTVVKATPHVLVLEWIEPGQPSRSFARSLGRGLAKQHRYSMTAHHIGRTHGFTTDNFIGRTPQPNPQSTDWVAFFRDHRLGHQHSLLKAKGGSTLELDRALDSVTNHLDRWLDHDEPPALLHGDLWTGNAMADTDGAATIFDPAAYFGGRETDLAMTELFGGFGGEFFAAYDEVYPLGPGYAERRDLYNLYHLLNHANLFGGSYVAQSLRVAQKYA
ncbi:MAG: protein-ribulosamine 3-kinase [Myxococcota bacterium]|jgi:protein-ribulosamine 3-kinase